MKWGYSLTLIVLIISMAYLEAQPVRNERNKNKTGGGILQQRGQKHRQQNGKPDKSKHEKERNPKGKNDHGKNSNTGSMKHSNDPSEHKPNHGAKSTISGIGGKSAGKYKENENQDEPMMNAGDLWPEDEVEMFQAAEEITAGGEEPEYKDENEEENMEEQEAVDGDDDEQENNDVAIALVPTNVTSDHEIANDKPAQEPTSVSLENLKELLDVLQMAGSVLGEETDTHDWVCETLQDLEAPQLLRGIMRSNLNELKDVRRKLRRFNKGNDWEMGLGWDFDDDLDNQANTGHHSSVIEDQGDVKHDGDEILIVELEGDFWEGGKDHEDVEKTDGVENQVVIEHQGDEVNLEEVEELVEMEHHGDVDTSEVEDSVEIEYHGYVDLGEGEEHAEMEYHGDVDLNEEEEHAEMEYHGYVDLDEGEEHAEMEYHGYVDLDEGEEHAEMEFHGDVDLGEGEEHAEMEFHGDVDLNEVDADDHVEIGLEEHGNVGDHGYEEDFNGDHTEGNLYKGNLNVAGR